MTPRGQEPVRRQGEQGDSALRENAPAKYAPEGLDAKAKICAASARGGDISLDIPFYRTKVSSTPLVPEGLSQGPALGDYQTR